MEACFKTLSIEKQLPPSAEKGLIMIRIILILATLLLQGCASFGGGYDIRAGYFQGPTFSGFENGVIKGQLEVRQRVADEERANAYRKADLCYKSRHIGPNGWFSGSLDCIPSNAMERSILERAARDGDRQAAAERNYIRQQEWDNEVERGRSSVRLR